MSDTENQDLDEFHDVEEEAIFIKKEITVDVEPIIQNEVPADAEVEQEKSAQPADEDRTEDQVPDITGTEYVDPMTTSMDGIDELPVNEEAQEHGDTILEENEDCADLPDQLESFDQQEHYKTEKQKEEIGQDEYLSSHEDVPVIADDDKIIEESDAPVEEPVEVKKEEEVTQEAPTEEVQQEVLSTEKAALEPSEDPAVPIDENALTEQVVPADEVEAEVKTEAPLEGELIQNETPLVEDEPVPHDTYVEVPVEEIGGEETTATTKDEPVEEEMAPPAVTPETTETTEAEKEFELQAPPEGKRPRTPNELDNPAEDAPLEVESEEQHTSIPSSPKAAASEKTPSVPPTPKSANASEIPSTPKSAVGSVPLTPKSAVGEVPQTPKSSPGGSIPPTPKSAMANGGVCNGSIPGTPGITKVETPNTTPLVTPAAEATPKATGSPKSNVAFNFEETPATPKAESVVTFDDSITTPKTPKTPRTPRTPRTPKALKSPKTPVVEEQPPSEPTLEPESGGPDSLEPEPQPEEISEVQANGEVNEADIAELPEVEVQEDVVSTEVDKNLAEESEPYQQEEPESKEIPSRERAASPSPPPRARRSSPSPERIREHAPRDYVSYDQDSHRQVPPPRIPTVSSFSSWSPPEKQTYTPISPFVTNPNKYRNEYTASCNYRPNSTYTSHFDDIVSTGAFSSALYSTTRLIERSRSRTRERRQAMRSQRSASNYYRYTSQYPAPTRTREYSTPPSRAVSRPPSRSGSFISFMEYSGAKNGELSRANSRSSLYDSGLSRSSSRANVDMYVGSGRLSRVDSFVRDLHTPYEYEMPSTYERYRSASRPGGYSAINGYTSYTTPSYIDSDTIRRMKRYQHDGTPMIRSMYENRIGHLERSLSREKISKDRLRTEYSQLSNKLDQAMRQMDLLRSNSYSSLRSSSMPRTSVYSHFYPYY